MLRITDVAVPGLLLGQIIGRFGCIVNGDAYGGPTTLPWGFVYTNPNALIPERLMGVPTHPYPLYEMVWDMVLLGSIWILRKKLNRDGALFLVYIFFYSMGRFILTFVREEQIVWWGLQQAQVLALLAMIASASVALASRLGTARTAQVKVRGH